MANDINQMKRLLAQNPFNEDVRAEWKKRLEESRNANYDELSQQQYILPFDESNPQFMDLVKRGRNNNDPDRLRTEFLPLPFCGDPKADIWYIQINPRGNDVDLYDFFSISTSLKSRIKEELSRQTGRDIDDFRFCKAGEEEKQALLTRQRILIDQLDLSKEQHEFYPLNSAFKTIEHKGRKLIGSWEWWRSALCINSNDALFYKSFKENDQSKVPSLIGRQLFVMECFPYASEKQYTWQNEVVYPNEHPYKKFLFEMLEYAQKNGKYIVFRSELGFDSMGLRDVVSNPLFLRNSSRVYLTRCQLQGVNVID